MTSRGRPRLVDVANHLDLAPSTVSRALAGSDAVSTATRERVLDAARELGYTVNPAASALKRGQTLSIGLIAVMNHWYTSAVTSGGDRVAAERGYDFVVMNSAGRADESLLLQRARRLGTRVDGVLIVDVSHEGGLLDRVIDAVDRPVVLMGCESDGVASVVVDNVAIGAMAASHLRSLGHERTVVLAMRTPTSSAVENSGIRAIGFGGGSGFSPSVVYLPHDDSAARQQAILAATASVTGVFCTSDALAIETAAVLRASGRGVPETVSVVGVDDHPLSQPLGLTTIAQTPEGMGEIATRLLIDQIGGEAVPPSITVGTELLVRRTTGPPPVA